MHRDIQPQPRRDHARLGRITDAQARERKHPVRQLQQIAHRLRVIAHRTDRAATQPDGFCCMDKAREHDTGIDRRIHERVEMIVGKRLAAQFRDLAGAPVVTAKNQEHGCSTHPRIVRDEVGYRLALVRRADVDDIGLLQIAFRRRRQRACEQQFQQRRINRLRGIAPLRAVFEHARKRIRTGLVGGRFYFFAKAFRNRAFDARQNLLRIHLENL